MENKLDKFRADLRNGMTIEEDLIKHNLNIKTAMDMLLSYNQPPKKRIKKRTYEKTDEIYIYIISGRYVIKKSVRGTVRAFGGYDTMEDAIKVRDYLNENGWYQHRLKSAWKACGVKKEEW